ncbi:sensor domain-containing protein [Halovenus salina]|uniref:Sensor domain-containing protein n=1 Tax=Halovenus salina TaxID=1510225 RepID=A0ABD5W0I0_9EURY|nr:sensor domain-containing protein [Halovenus salina]
MNHSRTSGGSLLSDVFGVVADAQSYKNIAYLFLAFPLGLFYFVLLTVGFSLGLGLSVLLVGLVILLATVIGLRAIAAFERRLANSLLDVDIADPDDVDVRGDSIVETGKAYLRAASTWRGLGFVFLKFWVGILSFVLLVSFLGAAVDLVLAPVAPDGAFNVQINNWYPARAVDTPAEQAVGVIGGLGLALLAMHLINAFARVNAQIAAALLGPEDSDNRAANTR